jgi:hypothetical protein
VDGRIAGGNWQINLVGGNVVTPTDSQQPDHHHTVGDSNGSFQRPATVDVTVTPNDAPIPATGLDEHDEEHATFTESHTAGQRLAIFRTALNITGVQRRSGRHGQLVRQRGVLTPTLTNFSSPANYTPTDQRRLSGGTTTATVDVTVYQ